MFDERAPHGLKLREGEPDSKGTRRFSVVVGDRMPTSGCMVFSVHANMSGADATKGVVLEIYLDPELSPMARKCLESLASSDRSSYTTQYMEDVSKVDHPGTSNERLMIEIGERQFDAEDRLRADPRFATSYVGVLGECLAARIESGRRRLLRIEREAQRRKPD